MSAYKNAFAITARETGQRLQLASELLNGGEEAVLLDSAIAVRREKTGFLCDVIARGTLPPHLQVSNAKELFRDSTLAALIPFDSCKWVLVDDYGMGAVELWRES